MAQVNTTNRRVLTVCLLVGACVSVPFLASRLESRGTRVRAGSHTKQSQPLQSSDEFFSFVVSLPSYQALDRSLEDLADASEKCLVIAAENDSDSLSDAAEDYRDTLRRVKDNFESLVGRVGRERAETAFETLWMDRQIDFAWNPAEIVLGSQTSQ